MANIAVSFSKSYVKILFHWKLILCQFADHMMKSFTSLTVLSSFKNKHLSHTDTQGGMLELCFFRRKAQKIWQLLIWPKTKSSKLQLRHFCQDYVAFALSLAIANLFYFLQDHVYLANLVNCKLVSCSCSFD